MSEKPGFRAFSVIFLFFALLSTEACAVSWEYDLERALDKAKSSGEPIMADFYTDWCHWCDKLDSDTYSDSRVDELSRKFICVKIDADSNKAVASKYGVRGYPTVIFFDSNGKTIGRVGGYLPPEAFLKNMEAALEKAVPLETKGDVKEDAKASSKKADSPAAGKETAGRKTGFDRAKFESDIKARIKKMRNSNLELGGIIYDPKMPRAIINNTIVREGDVIEGAKVVKIKKNSVDLTLKEKTITLKLE